MGESGWKIRTTHSRNAPHPPLRRSPFPGGEGWGKSFPSGRCVAQRIESNIAAGGSYTIKSGAGSRQRD